MPDHHAAQARVDRIGGLVINHLPAVIIAVWGVLLLGFGTTLQKPLGYVLIFPKLPGVAGIGVPVFTAVYGTGEKRHAQIHFIRRIAKAQVVADDAACRACEGGVMPVLCIKCIISHDLYGVYRTAQKDLPQIFPNRHRRAELILPVDLFFECRKETAEREPVFETARIFVVKIDPVEIICRRELQKRRDQGVPVVAKRQIVLVAFCIRRIFGGCSFGRIGTDKVAMDAHVAVSDDLTQILKRRSEDRFTVRSRPIPEIQIRVIQRAVCCKAYRAEQDNICDHIKTARLCAKAFQIIGSCRGYVGRYTEVLRRFAL